VIQQTTSSRPARSSRSCRSGVDARAAVRVTAVAGLAILGGVLGGCRGDRSDNPPRLFFPDMDHQPKFTPQAESPFFDDGRTQRPELAGTVPFGRTSHDPALIEEAEWAGWLVAERSEMLSADDAIYRGVSFEPDPTGAGEPIKSYLDYIPVRVTNEMIKRGQERFNIFCSACHGYTGAGGGTVGNLWSYPPPNLLAEQYVDRSQRQGKDGYLFDVVRNGVINASGAQAMPGYGEKINVADSWAVVAYLRTLQRSQNAEESEVPAEFRPRASSAASGSSSGGSPSGSTDNSSDSAAVAAGGEQ
jgi:mono/diheme cytochrome c family protein